MSERLMIDPDFNDKSPSMVTWTTYTWVWALSIWGSIVSHIEKIRNEGEHRKIRGLRYRILDLIADIFTGAFMGMIVFYILESYHENEMISAAIVGVSSTMSTKFLNYVRSYVAKKLEAL